jgi:hypothetical protein
MYCRQRNPPTPWGHKAGRARVLPMSDAGRGSWLPIAQTLISAASPDGPI